MDELDMGVVGGAGTLDVLGGIFSGDEWDGVECVSSGDECDVADKGTNFGECLVFLISLEGSFGTGAGGIVGERCIWALVGFDKIGVLGWLAAVTFTVPLVCVWVAFAVGLAVTVAPGGWAPLFGPNPSWHTISFRGKSFCVITLKASCKAAAGTCLYLVCKTTSATKWIIMQ